jgi:hypothetical protein
MSEELAAFTLFGSRTHALVIKYEHTAGGVFLCGQTFTAVVPVHRPLFDPADPDACGNCARSVRAAVHHSPRRNP